MTAAPARRPWSARRVDAWAFGAGIGLMLVGAVVELAAGLDAGAVVDWTIGAGFTLAAVRSSRARSTARPSGELALGLSTAALWFAATGAEQLPTGWRAIASAVTVIGYRGPLLHWLVRHADAPRRGPTLALLVVGYAAALTGTRASATLTAVAALGLAAAIVATARRRRDDARRVARATAAALAALGLVWAGSASALLPPAAGQVLDTVVLFAAIGLLAGPAGSRGLRGAVGSLVVELGPSGRQDAPVSATLARALADPRLRLRTYSPDTGWTDEFGRPTPDPVAEAPGRVTVAHATDGSRVALVHGEPRSAEAPLARAAAAAALLAVESVRWEARARREAADVRESTARLMTVDDEERRSLAERLHHGPLSRLADLRHALAGESDELQPLADELDRVTIELEHLADGLDPGGIATEGLSRVLARLCDDMPFPVEHRVSPGADSLPAELATLTYFVTAEALTNVARHAVDVQAARLVLDITQQELHLTIEDDGRGGAVLRRGRGLQGLHDRVALAGGRLTLDSPSGGPTRVVVRVPRGTSPAEPSGESSQRPRPADGRR